MEARKKLEPARLGVATGMSMANINRRPREIDGSVPYVGLNPEGPVDRQIGLIRLERADGSLLALIASYAMHGTVLPVNGPEFLLISGDAQGVVAEYVEEKTGAPLLLMSGAEGDVAPIYSTITMPHAKNQGLNHLSQFKVLLGDRILAANRSVAARTTEVRLWTGRTIIETPLKEKQTVWYQEAMRGLKRETDEGVTLVRNPGRLPEDQSGDPALGGTAGTLRRDRHEGPRPISVPLHLLLWVEQWLPRLSDHPKGVRRRRLRAPHFPVYRAGRRRLYRRGLERRLGATRTGVIR